LGTTYDVFSISQKTVSGGVDLGSFAAWLYTKFTKGAITIANDLDANAIQIGIWRSMGYLGANDSGSSISGSFNLAPLGTKNSPLRCTLTYEYYNDLAWTGAASMDVNGNKGTYTGDVSILNLKGLDGGDAQDQLVRHMPEPMSVVVWSFLAMCG